jgi:hypothetical protein
VDIYSKTNGLELLHKATQPIDLKRTSLEQVKEICLINIDFIENIAIDYIGNPSDALNYLKKMKKLKKEIEDM